MSKTISQVFDEFNDDIKQEIYRIVGWSLEHKKIHPVIKQYESDQNVNNLYSCKDWCWFRKLTEEQKICIAALVKEAVGEKEDYSYEY